MTLRRMFQHSFIQIPKGSLTHVRFSFSPCSEVIFCCMSKRMMLSQCLVEWCAYHIHTLRMHTHTHAHTHTHTHTHTHIHIHTQTHIHTHTHTHIHTHVHTHVHAHIHLHIHMHSIFCSLAHLLAVISIFKLLLLELKTVPRDSIREHTRFGCMRNCV